VQKTKYIKIHAVVPENIHMFIGDRQTNSLTTIHIWTGEVFPLFKKITPSTHCANFTLLICSVFRGIRLYTIE